MAELRLEEVGHQEERAVTFAHLPGELVEQVLSNLPTKSLVLVASTSHLFYNIVSYIIHARIRSAFTLEKYYLIFECYLPSKKYSQPYNECTYLGTFNDRCHLGSGEEVVLDDGAAREEEEELVDDMTDRRYRMDEITLVPEGEDSKMNGKGQQDVRYPLAPLGKLYSHFRPHPLEGSDVTKTMASTKVSLDAYEVFTQLTAQASLVKVGPRQGLFESVVPVFDNWFRVRRDWLRDSQPERRKMLWIGGEENVGLRLKVAENRWNRPKPILVESEDEFAVSYLIEYEEMVIRTAHLLAMIEKSKAEQGDNNTAVVMHFNLLS